MKNIEALKNIYNDYNNGTSQYYRHVLCKSVVCTDGVVALIEAGEAAWLFDEIAFAQIDKRITRDPMLSRMQFWTMKSNGKGGATLFCERDSGDCAFTIDIEYTDFPFEAMENGSVRLWVAPTSFDGASTTWVVYLPSEH